MGGWHNINKFDESKKTRSATDKEIVKLLKYGWPDQIISSYLKVTKKRVDKLRRSHKYWRRNDYVLS